MSRPVLAALAVLLLFPVKSFATEQTVLGSKLLVKNPGLPEKRKVIVGAKEVASPNTLVGDPVTNGATLTIRLTGGPLNGETYNLLAGTDPASGKPFWSGDTTSGFKYKDKAGTNGPVSGVKMSLKSGTFKIKATVTGKLGPVNITPPNPGADGCVTLAFNGGGDAYSINYATGTAKNDGTKTFKIIKPTSEGTCIPANPNNLPVDHIVVLMQENRSADNYLSQLSNQGQPAYEAEPTTGNPDPTNPSGPPIVPYHETSYCTLDLDHSWKGTHAEVNGGLMNGFTTTNAVLADPTGHRTMGYYDQTDLPFYFGMYNTFATGDRYFCSVQAQTDPNRLYLLAGTSFGFLRTGEPRLLQQPSVFNLLDNAGVTWRIYTAEPTGVSYGSNFFLYVANRAAVRVFPMAQYYSDLADGTLPNVAFVDPSGSGGAKVENDEHPPADIQIGQKFAADVINGLMASPVWATSAMFFAYDEHGGYYDHVPPPAAPIPDAIPPRWRAGDPHDQFDHYGVRVPVAVVSPYSKSHFVSHVVHDHTSILRFIETRFALPSLTNRDAAADPMLEFFDFSTATFATPPSLPAAVIDQTQLNACPG